jgi:TPR repeat protein
MTPGQHIGPYVVEETIGRGGAGVVLLRREARSLTRLRHPGVGAVLDEGESGPLAWVAMELAPGGTLADRLRTQGPLDLDAALDLAWQLADALAAVHGAGLLHRDLKPENVLCAADGRYVIADFGLVKELDVAESTRLSQSGALQGTPGYWAPEQALGAARRATPSTDVYLLGATLYAALTGDPPFTGGTLLEVVAATRERSPEPPSQARPETPPWLDALILRCLEKDPAARYADGAELRAALDARGPTEPPKRRGAIAAMLSLSGLLLLGTTVVLTSGPPRSEAPVAAEAPPKRPPLDDASPEELRAAADAGIVEAMYLLSVTHLRARPRDEAAALPWLRRAAEAGHPKSMTGLALILQRGNAVPADPGAAMAWLRRAAEAGEPGGMTNLALGLRRGDLGAPDWKGAAKWFGRAAELEDTQAMVHLAECLDRGRGVPRDPAQALSWLRRATSRGERFAYRFLGAMHEAGRGTPKNEAEARAAYLRGSELGSPLCMIEAARMLAAGDGGPRDLEAAARWLDRAAKHPDSRVQAQLADARSHLERQRRADPTEQPVELRPAEELVDELRRKADQGDTDAMVDYGILLERGDGVPQDLFEARRRYRQAAGRGNLRGMVNLGSFLVTGRGGRRDQKEAQGWFRRAAEAGSPAGMRCLANLLFSGLGVPPDPEQGLTWYRRAAEAGDLPARSALGLLLLRGEGVPRDEQEGLHWLRLAAEGGDPEAQDLLRQLSAGE